MSNDPNQFYDSGTPVLASTHTDKPLLSVIVVVYDMNPQAYETLYSLSVDYQHGVHSEDYEVIVMENRSRQCLDPDKVKAFGPQFNYHLRDETTPSPCFAINHGGELARSDNILLLVDGARMLSPGVLQYTIAGLGLTKQTVVSVPGYHLGRKPQQQAVTEGYDSAAETALLESIDWPRDGYRLFDIAVLSGTSSGGYFKPLSESNALAMPKALWQKLGGVDEGFKSRGGGFINLDLYKRAVEDPDSQLVVLPGEGSFHQLHGGVSTNDDKEKRRAQAAVHREEYEDLRGAVFSPPGKRPVYLGTLSDNAMKFVQHSAMTVRCNRGEIDYHRGRK